MLAGYFKSTNQLVDYWFDDKTSWFFATSWTKSRQRIMQAAFGRRLENP
jgi:hypothetical protein